MTKNNAIFEKNKLDLLKLTPKTWGDAVCTGANHNKIKKFVINYLVVIYYVILWEKKIFQALTQPIHYIYTEPIDNGTQHRTPTTTPTPLIC